MDSAQDKYTLEIVEAEQLWLLDVVDKERYICRGCGIKVTPASYHPTNVVRPYFAARDGDHQPGCDVDGEKKLVAKGKKGRLSTPRDGFPVSYPSRLILRDLRQVVDAEGANRPTTGSGGDRSRNDGSGAAGQGRARRRDANTIRPICRTFINFPYDRDLELSIPGVDATSYRSAFKKLKWDELARYTNAKLFYAAIRWNKPVETEEYLEITVDAGVRDANKLLQGHRVRAEWVTWSKAKRSYVRNEIEAARKEAIEAKAKNPKIKGYLFFMGEQDATDESLFHVTDYRLICCLVDEITYPATGR